MVLAATFVSILHGKSANSLYLLLILKALLALTAFEHTYIQYILHTKLPNHHCVSLANMFFSCFALSSLLAGVCKLKIRTT